MKKALGLIIGLSGIITVAFSVILKMKKSAAISIIGGADGPTSVFIAGKVGADFSTVGIICGIALLIFAIFWLGRKKK